MSYNFGRLLDHVHLRVADVDRSKTFYRAVLESIGRLETYGEGDGFFYADELYVDQATDQASKIHLAFQARSPDQVRNFYLLAVTAGGKGNGEPGFRQYHPTYYAAYVADPDGNNIEVVFHGPTIRSVESVEVKKVIAGARTEA